MCTSFCTWQSQPLYGLNFDFSLPYRVGTFERSFAMLLDRGIPPLGLPLGVTPGGTMVAVQITRPVPPGRRRPGEVGVRQMIKTVLRGKLQPDKAAAYLEENLLRNQRDSSVHCLMAAKDGSVAIIDPDRGVLDGSIFPDGFALMTNFPLWDHLQAGRLPSGRQPEDAAFDAIPCHRYKTATRMLLETPDPGVDRAFEILEAVHQPAGKLPTIFSMVALPASNTIYFSLYRDFSRRYRLTLADRVLRGDKGFPPAGPECRLTGEGVPAQVLAEW